MSVVQRKEIRRVRVQVSYSKRKQVLKAVEYSGVCLLIAMLIAQFSAWLDGDNIVRLFSEAKFNDGYVAAEMFEAIGRSIVGIVEIVLTISIIVIQV